MKSCRRAESRENSVSCNQSSLGWSSAATETENVIAMSLLGNSSKFVEA